MRQFEGFTNKQVLTFDHNDAWQVVTMPWLDDDAVAVTVEFHHPVDAPATALRQIGARPIGTASGNDLFTWRIRKLAHQTVIVPVNVWKQIEVRAQPNPGGDDQQIAVSITGQWGGDAVKSFGVDYPQATGWTEDNFGTYRDFDLTSLLPVEDRGNVAAVICHCWNSITGGLDGADARGNGSTWVGVTPQTGSEGVRYETIVPVDENNIIEVREGGEEIKFQPTEQDGWVYFVGYILRGPVDDGSGTPYEYKAPLDPVDEAVWTGAWQTLDVSPNTSPVVDSIYFRVQGGNPPSTVSSYAREVGSTDDVITQAPVYNYIPGFPLRVDASKEIEHYFQVNTTSWVFGWLETVPPEQATDPVPAHLSINININQVLSWTAGARATSHDVYFGTSPVLTSGEFQGNQAGTAFNPGTLVEGVTYYWRVDEVNLSGTTIGVVWQFTVIDPCNWFDPEAPGPDWQDDKAGPDWYDAKAGPDWFETKAAPDWAAATSGEGWFTPQECD